MYQKTAFTQLEIPEFYMPFGGKLNSNNRWVRLKALIPWEEIEDLYSSEFSSRGPKALKAQIALGALIIKERLNISDRETVEQIQENPYLQYFIGFEEFSDKLPFDASSMVHFRKRFTAEIIQQINESLCLNKKIDEDQDDDTPKGGGSEESKEPNQGQLIVDATCTPADITYPTDMKLLNDSREKLEEVIDRLHTQRVEGKKPRTYRQKARKDFLRFIKNKKATKNQRRAALRKQLSYVKRNLKHIEYLKEEVGLRSLDRVLYRKLLVINEIYRQQQELYDRRSMSISDRIVSVSQPHIRPIVRGKTGKKYEFGAKISVSVSEGFSFLDRLSWNAYNENEDLKSQIETFKQRFGHYPESVHADQIYRSRENRAFCKERGIRLSGKPLGRPPKDEKKNKEQAKQFRQDEAIRVAVEGKFGQGKRRFGLGRIMAKLSETSESVIALIFLIMNLEKRLANAFLSCFVFIYALFKNAVSTFYHFPHRVLENRLIDNFTKGGRKALFSKPYICDFIEAVAMFVEGALM